MQLEGEMTKKTDRKTMCPRSWAHPGVDWKVIEYNPADDPARIAGSILNDTLGNPLYARFSTWDEYPALAREEPYEPGVIHVSFDATGTASRDLWDNSPFWMFDLRKAVEELISDHCLPYYDCKVEQGNKTFPDLINLFRELADLMESRVMTDEEQAKCDADEVKRKQERGIPV